MRKAALSVDPTEDLVAAKRRLVEEMNRKKATRGKGKESAQEEVQGSPQMKKGPIVDKEAAPKKRRRADASSAIMDIVDDDDGLTLAFPAETSTVGAPKELMGDLKKLLFPADERRLKKKGIKAAADQGLLQIIQGFQALTFVSKEIEAHVDQKKEIDAEIIKLRKENEQMLGMKKDFEQMKLEVAGARSDQKAAEDEVAKLQNRVERLRDDRKKLTEEKANLKKELEDLEFAKAVSEVSIGAKVQVEMLRAYKAHGGLGWDVDGIIANYEKMEAEEAAEAAKEQEEEEAAEEDQPQDDVGGEKSAEDGEGGEREAED